MPDSRVIYLPLSLITLVHTFRHGKRVRMEHGVWKKKLYRITVFALSCHQVGVRIYPSTCQTPLDTKISHFNPQTEGSLPPLDHFRGNLEPGAKEREESRERFYPHRMCPSYTS